MAIDYVGIVYAATVAAGGIMGYAKAGKWLIIPLNLDHNIGLYVYPDLLQALSRLLWLVYRSAHSSEGVPSWSHSDPLSPGCNWARELSWELLWDPAGIGPESSCPPDWCVCFHAESSSGTQSITTSTCSQVPLAWIRIISGVLLTHRV